MDTILSIDVVLKSDITKKKKKSTYYVWGLEELQNILDFFHKRIKEIEDTDLFQDMLVDMQDFIEDIEDEW